MTGPHRWTGGSPTSRTTSATSSTWSAPSPTPCQALHPEGRRRTGRRPNPGPSRWAWQHATADQAAVAVDRAGPVGAVGSPTGTPPSCGTCRRAGTCTATPSRNSPPCGRPGGRLPRPGPAARRHDLLARPLVPRRHRPAPRTRRDPDQLRQGQTAPGTEPRRRTPPPLRRHRPAHRRGIRRSRCLRAARHHARRPNHALASKNVTAAGRAVVAPKSARTDTRSPAEGE